MGKVETSHKRQEQNNMGRIEFTIKFRWGMILSSYHAIQQDIQDIFNAYNVQKVPDTVWPKQKPPCISQNIGVLTYQFVSPLSAKDILKKHQKVKYCKSSQISTRVFQI